jgi:hypothetical protein
MEVVVTTVFYHLATCFGLHGYDEGERYDVNGGTQVHIYVEL